MHLRWFLGSAANLGRNADCARYPAGNGSRFTAFAAALGLCVLSAPPAPAAQPFVQEVAAGVYVHAGAHVPYEDDHADDIANIGFIVGGDCVAVIDSGGSVRVGQMLRRAIANVTERPVCYVINTHVHADHLLGNAAFRADAPQFAGHIELGDAVESSRQFFLDSYHEALGPAPGPDSVIGPDLAVDGSMDLDLGGRILRLTAHAPAHTHADLTVLDTATGTLWTGDLLFMDRIPALDGSLSGWIRIMEELAAQPIRQVIPGHGPVLAAWPEAAAAQMSYLTELRDEVRAAIAAGAFLDETVETLGVEKARKWLLHEQHHRRNVIRAWNEYEWE
jgi:quinoprotein relay system zinc metallohydrolase 2